MMYYVSHSYSRCKATQTDQALLMNDQVVYVFQSAGITGRHGALVASSVQCESRCCKLNYLLSDEYLLSDAISESKSAPHIAPL